MYKTKHQAKPSNQTQIYAKILCHWLDLHGCTYFDFVYTKQNSQ